MRAALTVNEDGVPRRHAFENRALIGRDADCDLILSNRTVSRKHALVEWEGSSWTLRDLQSGNGTFLGGKRISEETLSGGDALRFGEVPAVFDVLDEQDLSASQILKRTLTESLSVKPRKKAHPVAIALATALGVLLLVGVTLYEKHCGHPSPRSPAPAAAAPVSSAPSSAPGSPPGAPVRSPANS